jgi:ribosomal protein RSM22 (predicted rRNA methylase)
MTNPARRLSRPLESEWQLALDAVLSARFGLSTSKPADIAKLIPKVEELSRAYNLARAEGEQSKLPLEARIAFSFPRDVPKGAAAVRELLAFDALPPVRESNDSLRVIDLGAGLGAMTWGLARAIDQHPRGHHHHRSIDALLTDEDVDALRVAEAISASATEHRLLKRTELAIRTRNARLQPGSSFLKDTEPADIVFLGQVLSELAPRDRPEDRLAMQKELVTDILQRLVRPDGSLVIVEPALRDRTRHLHALRDQLIPSFTVFAPCLHQKSCPALAIETEWCHEDLTTVDLPSWVVPIARGAGLRWQGLTFSYLILRKDGRTMAETSSKKNDAGQFRFRAISSLIPSKGKTELFICDERGERQRLRRLDRDEKAHESGIDQIERGDIVTIRSPDSNASAPVVDDRGRIVPQANVAIDVGEGRK